MPFIQCGNCTEEGYLYFKHTHNPTIPPPHTHTLHNGGLQGKTNNSLSKKDQDCFPYFSALVKLNPLPHKKHKTCWL